MERIALGNREFEGRNNAYLLADDGEVALVDTGVATAATRDQLRDGLADRGYGFEDVDTVVLTHWHYDHAGLASEIQGASGATVYAHVDDAPLIEDEAGLSALFDRQLDRVADWGMPEDKQAALVEVLTDSRSQAGGPVRIDPLEDGDVLSVAGRTLEVVHVPGHTAGLSSFAIEGPAGPEAFVGDAVLPVYTPNIGGADVRVEAPLATYARSLERLIDRDFERLWPGHRDPIDDPRGRAEAILQHHRDRTQRVLEALRELGPADPWTVSAELFGELVSIHILHGPGEAWAHLDHLERHGVVERAGNAYRLVDEDVTLEPPELT